MAVGHLRRRGHHPEHPNHHHGHDRESEPDFLSHCVAPFLGRHELIELGDILVLDMHHFLQLLDVDLLDVLHARGPLALLQAEDAADHFDDALHQQERPGDRDDGLEGVDRRTLGGDARVLQDRPGVGGIVVAGPAERDHPGQEEHDVERQVEAGLQPRREEAVEDVAANVAVLRERVGARHHEQGPVHHEHGIEGIGVRGVERVAREDFVGDEKGERHDEPGKRLADKRADLVDGEQYFLHVRILVQKSATRARTAPGWLIDDTVKLLSLSSLEPSSPEPSCRSNGYRPCAG